MSKSDSDSEQSYCSDDSEFNYIPGPYVIEAIEDEEANANEAAASPTDDTLDSDTFKPYEDEPIASEEWVSEYEKRQETQADFERKLQDRFEGIQLVNSWWVFVASFDCFCHAVPCSRLIRTIVCILLLVPIRVSFSLFMYDSTGANVADVTRNIYRTPTNFSVVQRLPSA